MTPVAASRVLFVGLIRDGARVVAAEIDRISRAFAGVAHQDWLIVTSDNRDDTLAVLEAQRARHDITIIDLGALEAEFPDRTTRLAHCRNRYLHEIRNNPRLQGRDYIAVVDLDGVNALLTRAAVDSCWRSGFDWDACFANQRGPYYDVWALRHPLWSPNDCYAEQAHYLSLGANYGRSLYASVYRRMIRLPETAAPIPVQSAFGGLGIYKAACFEGVAYSGQEDGRGVCEHVPLHHAMVRAGARLFINPRLINGGVNAHSSTWRWACRLLICLVVPTPIIARYLAWRSEGAG